MARDRKTSFRAPDEVFDILYAAADRSDLSWSAYLREVIVVVGQSGLTLPQLVVALGLSDTEPPRNGHRTWSSPNPRLGMSVAARSCLHPPHLITRFPTFDRCSCGWERQR